MGGHEGRKVFVPFSIPGEEVVCQIVEDRKQFARAEIVEVIHPSPQRKQPPCPYFGRCGGCQWQHIDESAQVLWKHRVFVETLSRLGKISDERILPLIPSPQTFAYRNRVTLHVDNGRIGFFASQSNSLIEIDRCLIAAAPINETLTALIGRSPLRGLETVELTASPSTSEVTLFANGRRRAPRQKQALEALFHGNAKMKSVVLEESKGHRASTNEDDVSRSGIEFHLNAGLTAPPVRLWFSPGVFTQVNWPQNERMVQLLLSRVNALGADLSILELHAGAGNFTVPLALSGHRVQPVEWSRAAVNNSRFNLLRNGVVDVRPLRQTAEKALADLPSNGNRFDLVVVDPPRSGLKREIEQLAALHTPHILYVSCDPATLARDIARLTTSGYRIEFIQPFDFFPQTYHVESLTHLSRL